MLGYEIYSNRANHVLGKVNAWDNKTNGSIEDLIEVLKNPEYILDPTFEEYGNFLKVAEWLKEEDKIKYNEHYLLSGNFYNLSCVFRVRIEPSRMDLIELFKSLITEQQSRPEYQKAKEEYLSSITWSGVCICGNNRIVGQVCSKCHRQYKYVG